MKKIISIVTIAALAGFLAIGCSAPEATGKVDDKTVDGTKMEDKAGDASNVEDKAGEATKPEDMKEAGK